MLKPLAPVTSMYTSLMEDVQNARGFITSPSSAKTHAALKVGLKGIAAIALLGAAGFTAAYIFAQIFPIIALTLGIAAIFAILALYGMENGPKCLANLEHYFHHDHGNRPVSLSDVLPFVYGQNPLRDRSSSSSSSSFKSDTL